MTFKTVSKFGLRSPESSLYRLSRTSSLNPCSLASMEDPSF
jgi:hypothetical protein